MRMLSRTLAAVAALCLVAPSAPASGPDPAALRSKIKHVFIIYQENHSFDNYFGTFPGADNLATAEAQAHGFRQYDPIGRTWVTPFRIADPDTESPAQGRVVIYDKMNGGAMDRFVATQESLSQKKFDSAGARDVGLMTMAHYDCDTIPFLWKYARTFALYDHIFSAFAGPSTPSAVSLIAGQAGQTQRARNPSQATDARGNESGPGVPIMNDLDPAYGPYSEADKGHQIPQRYATLMLALAGSDAAHALNETSGVARDLGAVAASGRAPIPWGWYQEGYVSPTIALPGYETHHNAPQYFGYLRQNDVFWKNVHDARSMLNRLRDGTLPGSGIFYIKGASQNNFGWKPANPDPYVQTNYKGDDDHPGPGDTDAQIGEAFVATFVNAIARSKYWSDSAIVITWDDPGGYYDHVPPPHFETCPDERPCGDGPRLPFILISPYARAGAIVHDAGDQTSILKFAETLFALPSLASLPDEQPYMPEGPRDSNPAVTDLLAGFDPARLSGEMPPIAAAQAEIPDEVVNTMPAAMSCATLGVAPVALPNAPSAPPPNFMPRPRRTKTAD
ncbi:MAG: alkaline phosphatase family protein [Candidatus Cybelea sp.]